MYSLHYLFNNLQKVSYFKYFNLATVLHLQPITGLCFSFCHSRVFKCSCCGKVQLLLDKVLGTCWDDKRPFLESESYGFLLEVTIPGYPPAESPWHTGNNNTQTQHHEQSNKKVRSPNAIK